MPVVSCPPATRQCEEPGSVCLVTSHRYCKLAIRLPPTFLLQAKHVQLPGPLTLLLLSSLCLERGS